jgi:hypothetical protein
MEGKPCILAGGREFGNKIPRGQYEYLDLIDSKGGLGILSGRFVSHISD